MAFVRTIRLSEIAAAFTTCPAPWGALHIAASELGVVAVDLAAETPEFVDGLAKRLRGPVVPMDDGAVPAAMRDLLAETTGKIGQYFAGERQYFKVKICLMRLSAWDLRVLIGATRLQYGETASYGELAGRIGKPGAAQAVGGSMGRNPIPILIPCHRVIAAGGRLGGYGGSNYADRRSALAIKRTLLGIEGVEIRD